MTLYYYDKEGYKISVAKKRELFTLAERGIISPDSRIEVDGKETKAKNIVGIKFIAPEYYSAEEMFDPKNYNLDEMPSVNNPFMMENDKPTIEQSHEIEIQQQKNETKIFFPITIPKISLPTKTVKTNDNTDYWYLRKIATTYYILATIVFYVGLTLTALGTLDLNPASLLL